MKRYILLQTLISLAVGLSIAFYAYPLITKALEPETLPFVAKLDKRIQSHEPSMKQGSGWDSSWEETRGAPAQPKPIDWDLWLTRAANTSAVLVILFGPIGSWFLYRRQQMFINTIIAMNSKLEG